MIWCSNKITSKINVNPHVKMTRFIWFVQSSYRNCGSSLCHLSLCQWSPWSHIFLQVLGGGSCMMPLLQMPKVLSAIWRQLSGSSMARWITVLLFPPRSASAAHAVAAAAVLVAGLQADAAAQRLETTAQEEVLRNAQHAQVAKHT